MKIGNITPPNVNKLKKKTKVEMPPKSFASVMKETMKTTNHQVDNLTLSSKDVGRAAKVEDIKQQVQSGTYKINHEEVAKAILKKLNL